MGPIFAGLCVLVGYIHQAQEGRGGHEQGEQSGVCHVERIFSARNFFERLDLVPAITISSRCVWALHRPSTVRGALCTVALMAGRGAGAGAAGAGAAGVSPNRRTYAAAKRSLVVCSH